MLPYRSLSVALLLVLGLVAYSNAEEQEAASAIRHSFFVAGPSFTGIIDEDGKEAWDSGKAAARDGYVLSNGNILIAWVDEIKEFTPEKKVVFHYRRSPANQEIGTVQRLESGHTLLTELGAKPRLIEVSDKGEILVDVPLQPETENAHMQTRMARKLANGNYLVPHLLAFKLKEYTSKGKVVQTFSTDGPELGGRGAEAWPFTAIRLPNGRTLVTLTHANKVVELSAQGEIVWSISNEDFTDKPLADPCGAHRLPNGNTVIASYGSKGPVKVLEVTPEKKLVWTYTGKHRAHEIQVLTTNGEPIAGIPLK